jgi:hypothetical protein
VIVNNRVAKGRQGMEGGTAPGAFAGDYDTPEQRVGRFQRERPWESCITLCRQWPWKAGDEMKPLDECLRLGAPRRRDDTSYSGIKLSESRDRLFSREGWHF